MVEEVVMSAGERRVRTKVVRARRRARAMITLNKPVIAQSLLSGFVVGNRGLTPENLTHAWWLFYRDLVWLYCDEPFNLTLGNAETQAIESVVMLHLLGAM